MLQRSIPGYHELLRAIGLLARRFVQPQSHIYDLGCSIGGVSLAIADQLPTQECTIIAVDSSPAMVELCGKRFEQYRDRHRFELIESDLAQVTIERASVVVLNFTMQFIDPPKRQAILNHIHRGLNQDGVLIISEKISFTQQKTASLLDNFHLDFKRANGYSELEISQKRSALEQIMHTDTLETHRDRLRQAGFSQVDTWFQLFNFASMIAIKS